MEVFNFLALGVAALMPLVVGSLWYSPIGFQNAWMEASGVTSKDMETGNMPLIFGITLVLGFVIAFILQFQVIHQFSVYSLVATDPGVMDGTMSSEAGKWFMASMEKYGNSFRTFSHGAVHGGIMGGLLFVTPIIVINALFERRGFKYMAIHAGYWIITLALMGGIVSAWQ